MIYKILILGWKINKWEESINSVTYLSYSTFLSFKKLNNIEVSYYDISCENLPKSDFVLIIAYCSDNINLQKIKEQTGAIKICSLREIPLYKDCFNFVYNLDSEYRDYQVYFFPRPPYNNELLKPTIKEPKTILLDHYWQQFLGTSNDLTYQIEEWLDEIKKEYKIYRIVRTSEEKETIKSFEIPIYYSNILEYLNNTEKIEYYIITHKEGFPYGLIDMACRGTKILSPIDFLPQSMIDSFDIAIFSNKEEFFKKLNNSKESKPNVCLSFDEIINIMDKHFKRWKL